MNILEMTAKQFDSEVARHHGIAKSEAKLLYRDFFSNGKILPLNIPENRVPAQKLNLVVNSIHLPNCRIVSEEGEHTIKFGIRLEDNALIETVLITAERRTTLCISSQAGCQMGCKFCATAQGGFLRNLSTKEIVFQVFTVIHQAKRTINNIVFMGMGEPFENFDAVSQAIRVISDQRGLNIPQSNISISTAGHIDGINRLAEAELPHVRLAVSINSADNDLRTQLMPINKIYPLHLLKEALLKFPLGKKGIFFIEYVLLSGINDSEDDADKLAEFLMGLPVKVNLIAYNQNDALPYCAPQLDQVDRFKGRLVDKKIFVRIRKSDGQGINAACGQLAIRREGTKLPRVPSP